MDNNSTIENSSQSLISKTSGLKVKDYVGYALGDAAGCLVFSLITSLLQKFYTDIFLLHPMFIMLMTIHRQIKKHICSLVMKIHYFLILYL